MDIIGISNVLICPACKRKISHTRQGFECTACKVTYQIQDGKINFLPNFKVSEKDALNKLKNLGKKFPTIYGLLAEVIAPLYISKKNIRKIINEINKKSLAGLNIGSGITNYSKNVVNFDLQPFKNVNVVGDLFQLPFEDSSFDYVFSIYVLEHIPDPKRAIDEMYRVLKPGGICYCIIPFIQGFHAAPNDYIRLTTKGVESNFKNFEILTNNGVGPTSALLWIFQEWLAIILSFNSKWLHLIIHTGILFITFPIKYIDLILSKSKLSKNIACVNEVIAKKL